MTIQHKYCCSTCPYVSRQLSVTLHVDVCRYVLSPVADTAAGFSTSIPPGRLHFPNKSQRHFHSRFSSQSLATEPSRCGISVPALDLGCCDLLYKEKDTEGGRVTKGYAAPLLLFYLGGMPTQPPAIGSRKLPSVLEAGQDQAQRHAAALLRAHPPPPIWDGAWSSGAVPCPVLPRWQARKRRKIAVELFQAM